MRQVLGTLKKLESGTATAAGANGHCSARSLFNTPCWQNPVGEQSRQKEKTVCRVQPQHHRAGCERVGLELRSGTLVTSTGDFQCGQGSLISFEGFKTVVGDGNGGRGLTYYQLPLCPKERSKV